MEYWFYILGCILTTPYHEVLKFPHLRFTEVADFIVLFPVRKSTRYGEKPRYLVILITHTIRLSKSPDHRFTALRGYKSCTKPRGFLNRVAVPGPKLSII